MLPLLERGSDHFTCFPSASTGALLASPRKVRHCVSVSPIYVPSEAETRSLPPSSFVFTYTIHLLDLLSLSLPQPVLAVHHVMLFPCFDEHTSYHQLFGGSAK